MGSQLPKVTGRLALLALVVLVGSATSSLAQEAIEFTLTSASDTLTAGVPFTVSVFAQYENGTIPKVSTLQDVYLTIPSGQSAISQFGQPAPHLLTFDSTGQSDFYLRVVEAGTLRVDINSTGMGVPTTSTTQLSFNVKPGMECVSGCG